MRRRELIGAIGGTAASWPLVARAQQAAMPVVGFVSLGERDGYKEQQAAFIAGLGEAGFVEGRTVAIEYRWAENHPDRLPALFADLVQRNVSLLATSGGTVSALAAKAATGTIPIVSLINGDPVHLGLVQSFNRPGGNLTGVTLLTSDLAAKRLELLTELDLNVNRIGVLANPDNPNTETELAAIEAAARSRGRTLQVLKARSLAEIEAAFDRLRQDEVRALIVNSDPDYFTMRQAIVALAARTRIPAIYDFEAYVRAGGLINYGTDLYKAYRQMGVYVSRILKGTRPADLPVIQPTETRMVVNLGAARALGITVPESILVRADEVIE